jgi:hypothetical protein
LNNEQYEHLIDIEIYMLRRCREVALIAHKKNADVDTMKKHFAAACRDIYAVMEGRPVDIEMETVTTEGIRGKGWKS